MSETIFKKVMCSDGLPEKNGSYNTSLGTQYFSDVSGWGLPYRGKWEYPKDNTDPEFWFEQTELPSNDTMQELADFTYPKNSFEDEGKQRDYDLKRLGFKNGFNKAIALIKGQ